WKVHLVHGFFLNWGLRPGVGHGFEFNLVLIGALLCLVFCWSWQVVCGWFAPASVKRRISEMRRSSTKLSGRMRILIVAATDLEIAPLAAKLHERSRIAPKARQYEHEQHDIDVLTTGVGMVATAAWCSQMLTENRYDLALNLGVCGSFDREIEPAHV